ncbi:MAG: hypothetical protein WCE88_03325 [Burkholderiales bacterium]
MKDKTRADGLLLRYAEALKLSKHVQVKEYADKLQQRFSFATLRGDASHQREQARFAPHLQNDAPTAMRLAQENWQTQKEPADLRILLEAALAAKDGATISQVRAWTNQNKIQDPLLTLELSSLR